MKKIISLLFVWISINMYAHQPNLSSFIMSKTNDGKYVVQFVGALTGFEGEVNYNYGKGAFKTPEEFRRLVIDYFSKSTSFMINQQKIKFKSPIVILGHETKLVAEVVGVPKTLKTICLKNNFFKNTSHNKITVLFVLDNFPKGKYILDNKNQHQLNLIYKKGKWQHKRQKRNFIYYGIVVGVLILSFGMGHFIFKQKKIKLSEGFFKTIGLNRK